MASPITPTTCEATGRILTEWFELPDLTDEMIEKIVLDQMGLTEAPTTEGLPIPKLPPEAQKVYREYAARKSSYKTRAWKNGMSQQEVAQRMNEATKMVNPDNFKFLPDDVRERTGLEINPLWQMEVLYRAGLLNPKDQVALLGQLAAYTHSKAPSLQHNTNVNLKPEDWLVEIAKDEYETVDENPEAAQRLQPMQKREKGSGPLFDRRRVDRDEQRQLLIEHQTQALDTMLTELGDYYVEEGLPEFPDDADDS